MQFLKIQEQEAIVSTPNYQNFQVDLSNCDREPIQFIGRIQPHGFLLVLHGSTFAIEQVSQNIADFLPGVTPPGLLGESLHTLLSNQEPIFEPEQLLDPAQANPAILALGGTSFFAFHHVSEGKIILECEAYTPCPDAEKLQQEQALFRLHEQLQPLHTLEALGEAVADAVRKTLDYDRVAVMRFDTDAHTEVFAESRLSHLDSYLGHHFPASDIPAPARVLLREKPVRLIADVGGEAVAIVPYHNPSTGAPAHILRSELRNPSEMHLEYLRNMGVAASLSFSIIVRGQLWGVLSCHHAHPAFRNVWRRQQGLLMTHMLAAALAAVQENQDVAQKAAFENQQQALLAELKTHPDLVTGLAHIRQSPLAFSEASGAALVVEKQVFTFGTAPSAAQVLDLVHWLAQHTTDGVYLTRDLSRQFSGALAYPAVASGLLALEMSRYNQEYVLFFKPELKESRIWAGDPQKPAAGPDLRLHPRQSFAKWVQVIEGKSAPWLSNEVETAEHFVKDLTALQLSHQAAKLATNARLLALKNTQLNDLALIMSHNLRAPLVNIQWLHRFYKETPTLENAGLALSHIEQVAANMAQTLADLNRIMQIELQGPLPAEEVRLAKLIHKEMQNLGVAITESGADIQLDLQVPVLQLPKIYLESIIHNFLSNALKYRAPDRKPRITLKTWQDEEGVQLAVADNGVGMDMQQVGPKLFGLYNTFHPHAHAKGVGLYLTKLQVESLGGRISVHSAPNQGTTFTVSFPLDPYAS